MALETVNMQQSIFHSLQVRVASLEGKLVLSDYQKKKQAGELFQFPPFYTHPNGYHMALRVYANGSDGKGSYLSVHVHMLRGEHDDKLKWPFIGKVTFTLFNQLEDKNHHTRTLLLDPKRNARVGGPVWGFPKFIPHSALTHDTVKNTQYLMNDTLHFKVSGEAADY
jgi:TNF receptor-associated factor 4